MISEEKILFLTQLLLTMKKEILDLENNINNKDEKEFSRVREDAIKLCGEISQTLNSIREEM